MTLLSGRVAGIDQSSVPYGEICPKFDAVPYAVVQRAGSDTGDEADVFIPGFLR